MTTHNIDASAVGALAARLNVTWPIWVHWMTPDEVAAYDARCEGGQVCGGFREWSTEERHVIKLRSGFSAEQTSENIAHELAHCGQVERFGRERFTTMMQDAAAKAQIIEGEAYAVGRAFVSGAASYALVKEVE